MPPPALFHDQRLLVIICINFPCVPGIVLDGDNVKNNSEGAYSPVGTAM